MIDLIPYSKGYEEDTLRRMARFFGFHQALVDAGPLNDTQGQEALAEWQVPPSALYVIMEEDVSVGFLRIAYRGPIVAWIEDIYVDEARRGQGIATRAIALAEQIIRQTPGMQAVCMDVAPRNADALRLYHRLGYGDVSLLTLRKEFGESKRDRPTRLFGLDFRY